MCVCVCVCVCLALSLSLSLCLCVSGKLHLGLQEEYGVITATYELVKQSVVDGHAVK